MDRDTQNRLRDTCFRGRHHELAGNFCRWENPSDLEHDLEFGKLMLNDVLELATRVEDKAGNNTSQRTCIAFHDFVGWESTDSLDHYKPDELEEVDLQPDGKACIAMRVKLDRGDILAPRTQMLTVAYNLVWERRGWRVMVRNMYPGLDVGPLRRSMSLRKNVVFFDFNHPGA